MNFLDFIFPKKCINCRKFGDFICPNCFIRIEFNELFTCPACRRPTIDGMVHPHCIRKNSLDGVIPVLTYKNLVKKLIHQFKYAPNLSKLDQILGQLMTEGLSQNESFYSFLSLKPIVIPMPLSQSHLRKRGYNPAERLALYVAQYFRLKIGSKLLVRARDTGEFEVTKNNSSAGAPNYVILVDDLATFTTLSETAKVLKRAGIKKVIATTLAREI